MPRRDDGGVLRTLRRAARDAHTAAQRAVAVLDDVSKEPDENGDGGAEPSPPGAANTDVKPDTKVDVKTGDAAPAYGEQAAPALADITWRDLATSTTQRSIKTLQPGPAVAMLRRSRELQNSMFSIGTPVPLYQCIDKIKGTTRGMQAPMDDLVGSLMGYVLGWAAPSAVHWC